MGKHPSLHAEVVLGDVSLRTATELLCLKVLSIPKSQVLHLPFASSARCFQSPNPRGWCKCSCSVPIRVAWLQARPAMQRGISDTRELGMVFTSTTFWGNLASSDEGRPRMQRGDTYVQGEVLKAGQRSSAAGGDAWMFTQPVSPWGCSALCSCATGTWLHMLDLHRAWCSGLKQGL